MEKKSAKPAAKAAKKPATPKPAAKKAAPPKPAPPKAAAPKPAPKPAAKKPAAKKAAPEEKAAPDKKPARTVAKVSPNKGMDVGAWIGKFTSGWQAEALQTLVKLVLDTEPGATVSIKWNQPVFELNGPFAFIKPAKAHVTFGFWRGAEMSDPKGLLAKGGRMGHIKYTSLAAIDKAALGPIIRTAVKLNREKGNPTTRG